jgi:hypothetical protein
MFRKIKNLFKPQDEKQVDLQFFKKNETSLNPSKEKQFLISLSQIIGEHHDYYTNSLTAGTDIEFYTEKMENWYEITNNETADFFIKTRLREGFRDYYNEIVKQFIQTNGNASLLHTEEDDIEDLQIYFDNIKDVLKLREGQFWFANSLGITDAFDCGRLAYVIRSCYTIGYLSEKDAWDYLDEVGEIASEKFSHWNEYAKSYLLGRAIWCGDDGSFENFSEVSRYLVSSPISPWMDNFITVNR